MMCDYDDCKEKAVMHRGSVINHFMVSVTICKKHSKDWEEWVRLNNP
jgi:hypothetical protein